jgi:integrase
MDNSHSAPLSATTSPSKKSRKSSRLSAVFVRQVKAPGRYCDGDGLCLVVDPSGASRWVLRIQASGKRCDIGLGGSKCVSLADARERAQDIRRKVRAGGDPLSVGRRERAGMRNFQDFAATVHASHLGSWRNGKHTDQWLATLENYVFPSIGTIGVDNIEPSDILKVLLPIWTTKPETARRVMQRIRVVLDHAIAAGYRSADNPCRVAAIGLPKQSREVKHFAAIPYKEVPDFLPLVRADKCETVVKLALEFLILTAGRSGEVRGARKVEVDLRGETWTIPAHRMKSGREHIVPLSPSALDIVRLALDIDPENELLFASNRSSTGMLSDMAFTMVLRRLRPGITAHGFRSSFRDWCGEETDFSGEVAEMALAHTISSKVEAAYRRGNLLQKRKQMMEAWAAFVLSGK